MRQYPNPNPPVSDMQPVRDLRGQRVLVIEPTSSGAELLRAAREQGMEVIVASYDKDDRQLSEKLRGQVDLLLTVDANDEDALTQAVLPTHEYRPLCAVIPGFEFYVPAAARLARMFGVPALPAVSIPLVRDKSQMSRVVEAAGLRVPRQGVATTPAELTDVASRVGYPCVLKPTSSAGSVHVSRADTAQQLLDAYRWLRNDQRRDLGRSLGNEVLVQEYLQGQEFSVEGYANESGAVIVAVTRKLLGFEPHFVEVGHVVEADLTPDVRAIIEQYTRDVVRVLGLNLGPFHCEIRLVAGEPVLIELGARLPGDHIVDLVELVTGVSLPRITLAAHIGTDPARLAAVGRPKAKYAGIHFFTAPGQRSYRRVHGLDTARRLPGVIDVKLEIAPGEEIPPAEDFRGRLGYVIYTADCYLDALEGWYKFEDCVHFE